jgi:hypothetical protein
MQGRARRFEGLRWCAAALLGCWIAAPSAALDWQWGEVSGRLDSYASLGFSMRTQAPKCHRVPNLTGELGEVGFFGLTLWDLPDPANNPGGCVDPGDAGVNGSLLNTDDGNLNWKQWDVFSAVFKGNHDLELRWRNVGSFLRVSYFIDAIGADAATPRRTRLADDARWRSSVLEGGVVGGQFRLLDAYLFAGFEWAERYFDLRVGNQVVNWGEGLFTQGGINATNTIDVTKARLPGSDIREALVPAPIVKVGGDIIGALSFEAYYQFVWRKFDLDPPGTFFSLGDPAGRGAEGQFSPTFGDPGATGMTAEEIFDVKPVEYLTDSNWEGLLWRFGIDPNLAFLIGAPFLGDKRPSDQGQLGVALRYYFDSIETEVGVYYIRLHAKTPSVGFSGTDLGVDPETRMQYFREYPENIDLWGLSFNTALSGIALGGEVSVRRNEPVGTNSAQTDLVRNLMPPIAGGEDGEGGAYPGFVREMRLIGIVSGTYIVGPGTPLFGHVLRFIGAQDMIVLAEVGAQWFPDLLGPCPPTPADRPIPGWSPEERAALKCEDYQKPQGIDELDKLQVTYTIRAQASYDRFLGTPVTLQPVVSFRHDPYGVGPGNGSLFTNGVMQVGVSLVADYQQRWQGIVSYSNTFGAGRSNPGTDRDFLSVSISYNY